MTRNLPVLDALRWRRAVSGLARNPAAPLAVLTKIMRVPHVATEMTYKRERLPDELAEALLELSDPEVTSLLNRPGRVSPAIRERLARAPDPAVRERNRRLAREWVSKGSFVRLDMLEALTDRSGPPAWLELASDTDPRVRAATARAWFDRPDAVHRAFLTDPEPSVRAAAARVRPVPADLHPLFLAHPATRAAVAKYAALSDELARQLIEDDDEEVRAAVAGNPQLPVFACHELAAKGPLAWGELITNPATPEPLRACLHADLARIIASEKGLDIREASIEAIMADAHLTMALLPGFDALPLAKRLAYLDSPYPVFRRALARHRDLPDDALARLRGDADPHVLRYMAKRPDAPGAFVAWVLREHGDSPKVGPRLKEHPNLPAGELAKGADDPDARRRALACLDPLLPVPDVIRLSRDDNPYVRVSAAGHPNMPLDNLVDLFEDENLVVVEAAAASPTLPTALMHQIADGAFSE